MNDGKQTEIVTVAAEQPLTVPEMVAQVTIIQQMMTHVMKQNTHFGTIPGTPNPTLYKAGAEKIMATFRLAADPHVEDLGTDDRPRIRVTVRLISPSGRCVGAGVGECSGAEEKYCWRNAVCQEEYDEAPVDRRREKWKKGWQGRPAQKAQQVRTNPADLSNTILKMAKKRALVDAVLTATAASDVFAQDLEDLPQEYVTEEVAGQGRARAAGRTVPQGVKDQAGQVDADTQDLMDDLTEKANNGWESLQKAWGGLTEKQRKAVGGQFKALKDIAEKADGGGA